jgi:A/G-specific adenine glycosylase
VRARPRVHPDLRDSILAWYRANGRDLPFRQTTDPYAILVSEAMAQQTQAARAGEAWIRFMARFPTVESLAAAPLADVLRAWQGLGYNRRAVNLQRAAQAIVADHGGRVPRDLAALEALPGVGPYTARAVAALAFGVRVGPVDTNVRRVLGRIVAGDVGRLRASAIQVIADDAVPADHPGEWTHALMDLGATVCGPRRPDCGGCPAANWCGYATRAAAEASQTAAAGAPPSRETRPRTPAGRALPFTSSTRWLRGRIVERLRAAPNGTWTAFEPPIGDHDGPAVGIALAALERDGLIELEGVAGSGAAEIDRASVGVTLSRARLPG